ncbi:MAG: glycosyltransferase family 4 protein [Solirubrobacterales bacterium]|nr:glycosyltransferase family 4 protein [Solirubrobacterales bacterium]
MAGQIETSGEEARMRILIASDHYPPFIGGAHRWASVLAHGLAARGHRVAVAAPWAGGLARHEQEGDVSVHRVRQLRTASPARVKDEGQQHQPPFPDPVSIADLRKVIAEERPAAVLAHGWIAFSLVPALGSSKVPLLLTAHDYGYFCPSRMLLHHGAVCDGPAPAKCVACTEDFYGRPKGVATMGGVSTSKHLLRRRINGLASVSSYVGEIHDRHLLAGSERDIQRYTIPPPILLDPPGQGAADETVASYVAQLPQEPYILFVGAFRKFKGLEVLFDAYRRLDNPPPLALLGTYEQDTPGGFPPNATVITDVPHKAVMAAWDRCMFGVLPSIGPEPLGMVVVEGMSRGKAVIGTEPGGTSDALRDGAGVLVPKADPEALAVAMSELINDPGKRERIGAAAQKRARRFEPDHVLAETEQALEQLLAAGTSR